MQLALIHKFPRELIRVARSFFVIGIIPLLFTGCYRSMVVTDHLDMKSGWPKMPSLRLGSGDGYLFCCVAPSKGAGWSVKTWQDYDHDCRRLVLFADLDVQGPGFEFSVGYFGLILLSAVLLLWSWRRGRSRRIPQNRGFEITLAPPAE